MSRTSMGAASAGILLMALGTAASSLAGAAAPGVPAPTPAPFPGTVRPAAQAGHHRFPVLFLENAGQVSGAASFHAPLTDGDLFLHGGGMTRVLRPRDRGGLAWAVRHEVPGASADARWAPEGEPVTSFRWFRGRGHAPVRTARSWDRLELPSVRPGVDLLCASREGGVEYAFRVAPGADAGEARISWNGATGVTLLPSGALLVSTGNGSWEDPAPRAWSEGPSGPVPVDVAWTRPARDASGDFVAGFTLGERDATLPLVIDPGFDAFAGYVGGASADSASSVAAAAQGRTALAGETLSPEATFPVTGGPFLVQSGLLDGFVAMVAADGASLEWCGYVGGTGYEIVEGLAVDGDDDSVVAAGRTTSGDGSFPVSGGPSLEFGGGSQDAFVLRLASDGSELLHGGFIGGTGSDLGRAVAVDDDGTIVVAGESWSSDGTFPVVVGPGLSHGGDSDAFVARVAADGKSLLSCGFIGGQGRESAYGVALDSTGRMGLVGVVAVDAASFPAAGDGNGDAAGGAEAFFAWVAADGSTVTAAGLIGGRFDDGAVAASVDPGGRLVVGGWTRSSDLPTTGGPSLRHGGNLDGFVAAVAADGSLEMLGYMGGALDDEVTAVVAEPGGTILVAGYARSGASPFPVRGGPSTTHAGGRDGFVARIKPGGRGFAFCGYLGGSDAETVRSIASCPDGTVLVAGEARSLPTLTGPSTVYGGGGDAFVARLDPAPFQFVRTVDLTGKIKGALTDSTRAGKDKLSLRGSLTADDSLGAAPFDPMAEDLGIWAGDTSVPLGVTVPAGDAGWKIKGRKYLWKSPRGPLPKVKLLIDLDKGKFSLKATGAEFAAPPTGRSGVFFQGGRMDLEYEADWIEKKPGAFKSP